ncbi:amino acid ABC transporter permease, partial [Mesorhizobium sp. M7A.F.Ca.CA.004.05.1.1]
MQYQLLFAPVFANMDHLLTGAWITIQLSFVAMILGLIVGVVLAFAKTGGPPPLRWLI